MDEEATHAGIGVVVGLRTQVEHLRGRVAALEVQLGRAIHQVDQAESQTAQYKELVVRLKGSITCLEAKNAELLTEKQRLRDSLLGTHPLPVIHYRIEVDRDDTAYEHIVELLDAFPDKAHTREALAEARRLAARTGGRVRHLRLDSAWQVVIRRIIDG